MSNAKLGQPMEARLSNGSCREEFALLIHILDDDDGEPVDVEEALQDTDRVDRLALVVAIMDEVNARPAGDPGSVTLAKFVIEILESIDRHSFAPGRTPTYGRDIPNDCHPDTRTIRWHVLSGHVESLVVVAKVAAVQRAESRSGQLVTAFDPTASVDSHRLTMRLGPGC